MLAITLVISAVSAVDFVDGFNNDNFAVNVASGTNFTESVNVANKDMVLSIFENSSDDSKDANSIIYFKGQTADKSEINNFIKDLDNGG